LRILGFFGITRGLGTSGMFSPMVLQHKFEFSRRLPRFDQTICESLILLLRLVWCCAARA
jgi:hypothetical protein